ncbi:hypothetical protein Pmani_034595 [Petrolisthes manimaculis]|uniref:Uncharacterized protein n=1 Tax=Petrolisthes manimaculis TaxID=1843537 RepID=A0AAE1NPQ6_9EUCA|nr:hypothetical protein Pmani_034595 [Petrolisthes manimaculis]
MEKKKHGTADKIKEERGKVSSNKDNRLLVGTMKKKSRYTHKAKGEGIRTLKKWGWEGKRQAGSLWENLYEEELKSRLKCDLGGRERKT